MTSGLANLQANVQRSATNHLVKMSITLIEKNRTSSEKPPSTAAIIQRLQTSFLLTQPTIVRLCGYSPRSVASWSKGVKATEPAKRKFTELLRLLEALGGLIGDESGTTGWLQVPNPAFEGSTPLQVIERGETDRIWKMIYALESGEPG